MTRLTQNKIYAAMGSQRSGCTQDTPSAILAAFSYNAASNAAFMSLHSAQYNVAALLAKSTFWRGSSYVSLRTANGVTLRRRYLRYQRALSRPWEYLDIAGTLASSTTGSADLHRECFSSELGDKLRMVGGGVPRNKIFTKSELDMLSRTDVRNPSPVHGQYELLSIMPASWFEAEREAHGHDHMPFRIPLDMLIPKLDVQSLRDLCEIHDLFVTKKHQRCELEQLLLDHECVEDVCEDSVSVLQPYLGPPIKRKHDIQSSEFAEKQIKQFAVGHLKDFIPEENAASTAIGFRMKRVGLDIDMEMDAGDVLVRDLPLTTIIPRLTVPGLHTFASHHRINLLKKMSKAQCIDILKKHVCTNCRPLFYVLSPIGRKRNLRQAPSWIDDGLQPFLWDSNVSLSREHYPPRPTRMHDIASAMRDYCRDLSPEVIEEGGCIACGQLTRKTGLIPFDGSAYDLSCLQEINCTRAERFSLNESVRGRSGPVLDRNLSQICTSCHDAIARGSRPKLALANHLWVGPIPKCLEDLTLAEMAMVTRIRYNRCVVRISSGHAKMTANVIAFEHPTMKIYQRLPVGRQELDDVLAVLYTGQQPPTDDDLRRSPALVRRMKVKGALEWLKLNHKGYTDLEIDYARLDEYPLDNVPVGVYYKNIDQELGNVPDAAKSVFDSTLEEGTESGPCPYTVHGLTAERFTSMTTTQRKLAAVQRMKNGGKLLAIGHDTTPQSIFSNPTLYPQMFPWLFPYGHGGVDADEHVGKISREAHLRWLLMYHDKRFQRDSGFLIVAFNHQLIRQSTQGSFMMAKRRNFQSMVETVHQLDPGVLRIISERLSNGGRSAPQSPEEQKAFRVFDQIEYVGNRVSGTMARRKYLRGQAWSMIYFLNTPAWFITVSPADNKHPLCIHWAGSDEEFRPEIKGYEERKMLITRNPVACARFFHHLVIMFIKHLCGWNEEDIRRGIFGKPAAFFGTVEQQGRMTLHLHFLLWIQGQMSLNEIREKLMHDTTFVKEVTEYVESCLVGGFSTGTKDEVDARVPRDDEYEHRGIHSIMRPVSASVPKDYVNPTLRLPVPPPDEFCDDVELCGCQNCDDCRAWYDKFKHTLDDIILRSNVHQCFERADENEGVGENASDSRTSGGVKGADDKEPDVGKKALKSSMIQKKRKGRRHGTAKGCINKHGQCTARFPRDVYMRSRVDPKTGHLNVKHTDSSVNDVTPAVTVGNLCNTDTRFLLSGTAVKATVAYVTDYITKGWLKTYQVFSAMYDTFTRQQDLLDGDEQGAANATRKMIMKVVNSLSSKMEIGAPMAALYLLGNPDHYVSHAFIPFYWKNYTNYVHGEWAALATIAEPSEVSTAAAEFEDVGVARQASGEDDDEEEGGNVAGPETTERPPIEQWSSELFGDDVEDQGDNGAEGCRSDESVQLTRQGNFYVAKSNTDDYRLRPRELEDVSLYEFVQCAVKHSIRSTRAPRKDLRFFRLHEDHLQYETHVLACDPARRYSMIPNFLGPQLPRKDVGDREVYCSTMLTLFKPWRSGIDLKGADETWEERFQSHEFTDRARQLMENFNVRHECYDAKDDFAAMMKIGISEGAPGIDDEDSVYGDEGQGDEPDDGMEEDWSAGTGPATQAIQDANATIHGALSRGGWRAWDAMADKVREKMKLPKIVIDASLHSGNWRNIVKSAKQRLWRRKISAMGASAGPRDVREGEIRNDAFVVPCTYLSKDFEPTEKRWSEVMADIIKQFSLNAEQEKAFRIVANHACEIAPDQLMMHLGGMAGTGKSTVIRALTAFFTARKEPYRFVLMGPTGTSAALIGGSTYHSFLGLNTGSSSRASLATMEEVRERLTGVGYLLIDEQSMLNCRQLCAISARCCDALGVYEKPFGGLNVILCGDFAQLPPAKGYSLYSRDVSLRQSPRQSIAEQENTIGKLIWLQFTTVVILTENMRQVDDLPEEQAFRRALTNLRWHACSDEDIALIRSRLAGKTPGVALDSPGFKNVSIITARNRDKDHLNTANSSRFASEAGEALCNFYSTDSLLSVPSSRDPEKRSRVYSSAKSIGKKLQTNLWSQPPCTSENVAGKLSLCVGMPVLIRHNEATELCMTRGQEARIVGWTCVSVPRHAERKSLDVLYVELINPPKTVNLPHLPMNVVPLTKIAQAVDARLVNDEFVHISRSQVPILPNFSMTDYSSQGKTRQWNVVDLTECRNFQAAYTCLSRGTRLSQTLILRDFDDRKLKGNLDGALRQEYRELQHLATITDLRYRGILEIPSGEGTRWTAIDWYRAWKAGPGRHQDDAPVFEADDVTAEARGEVVCEVNTLSSSLKRKAVEKGDVATKRRKTQRSTFTNSAWESPAGAVWDGNDYSCAFDSWLFVLNILWSSDKPRWSRIIEEVGPFLKTMVESLENMPMEDPEIELSEVRDKLRSCLRTVFPRDYPEGTAGVDLVTLSRHLLNEKPTEMVTATCSGCGREESFGNEDAGCIRRYNVATSEISIQSFVDEQCQAFLACEDCGECTYRDHQFSPMLTFQVFRSPGIYLNGRIGVSDWGIYRLVGVIYFDEEAGHFFCRGVTLDNKVYSYDGMEGGYSAFNGILDVSFEAADLGKCREGKASLAVYALVNRRPRLNMD